MDQHKYVFVSGLHRSGTSLMFQILREQDDFSGFRDTGKPEDEGQHVQTVFKPAYFYGGPGKFGFDQDAYLNEHSSLLTPENNNRLKEEWGEYWDLSKTYLLEKSPPNLIRSRYLQTIFPDSYFITIQRHPIAVAFATRKWSKTSIQSLIEHWLTCYGIFEKDKGHLKNQMTIRYEDFVSQPKETISKIGEFLGTDLVFPEEIEVRTNVNKKYFEKWEKYSKGLFSKKKAVRIKEELEEKVNEYSYSLISY
ncbi:MAG: sulfotransferase [Chitinophagales bacterium]|nr:sulfotransferase [Chitinophagales bacterium]